MPVLLTGPTIQLIIQGIQAAIKEAPEVIAVVNAAKQWITNLFEAGVISAATQNALHAHVDAIVAAFASGQEPPEFVVAPDPGTF